MRFVILIVALIVVAFVIGWLKFNRTGDSATIEIDGAKMRSDSQEVLQEGRDLLDRGSRELQQDSRELNPNDVEPSTP